MSVPFARAWWSFELGDLRPCVDDYDPFPIESLPPLDESLFNGEYAWLAGEDDEDDDDESGDDDDIADLMGTSPTAKRLAKVVKALAKVKVKLPPAFTRFMEDANLQGAVPSCTGCEFELSGVIESPFEDDAWLVRFLSDPEGALYWYLYLAPGGGSYVVCSSAKLDDPKLDVPPAELQKQTWWCAPHFEHFVYRFWLENTLWEQLEDKGMLTPTEAKYLKHYKDAAKRA